MAKISKTLSIYYLFILFNLFNLVFSSLKFNIPNNREKCFTVELYQEGALLIRYDLKGEEFIKKEYKEKAIHNIKIFVKDPNNKIIKELYLSNRKDKFVIHTEKSGIYYICARYYKLWSLKELPKEVLLGIKIRTDYEYKEISQGLKKDELSDLMERIREVTNNVIPSISSSRMEIEKEDQTAKAIISTSNLYFKLNLIQLILIIIITIYQIFNLRKFLTSKRII